jgi:hypothetical protein
VIALLAACPYIAALASYWASAWDLFRTENETAPPNWNWRLVAPVLAGGLTPLALASKQTGIDATERGLLLSSVAAAILFVVVLLPFLQGNKPYLWLQRAIPIGRRELRWLPWRRFFVGLGSVILVYGASVNIAVSAS